MLTNPTIDKLHALNPAGHGPRPRRAARAARRMPTSRFEERLGLLVDREATDRENRRLERHLKAARLRIDARRSRISTSRGPRGSTAAIVLELAEGRWVAAHRNVLVTGPTGVGKTFLACALADAAIRRGHTALYLRVPRLLDELVLARADGRLPRLLAAWAQVDVLVLDDFGLQPVAGGPGGRPARGDRGPRRACAPPSSPASCRSPSGTRRWANRPRRRHPRPPGPQRLSAGAQGRLAPPDGEGC